jgi:uncharacterized protein (DUF924 family)
MLVNNKACLSGSLLLMEERFLTRVTRKLLMNEERINIILSFWFGDLNQDSAYFSERLRLWFAPNKQVDNYIREHFETDLEQALQNKLSAWEDSPKGLLALIILLDQFSLNLYRGEARSYDQSHRAIALADKMISTGFLWTLSPAEKAFVFMPYEHGEDLKYQTRAVELFQELFNSSPERFRPVMKSFLEYAERHYKVVKRFGRFPNRNQAYQRDSTAQEVAFLQSAEAPY